MNSPRVIRGLFSVLGTAKEVIGVDLLHIIGCIHSGTTDGEV